MTEDSRCGINLADVPKDARSEPDTAEEATVSLVRVAIRCCRTVESPCLFCQSAFRRMRMWKVGASRRHDDDYYIETIRDTRNTEADDYVYIQLQLFGSIADVVGISRSSVHTSEFGLDDVCVCRFFDLCLFLTKAKHLDRVVPCGFAYLLDRNAFDVGNSISNIGDGTGLWQLRTIGLDL
ncbi:hypothetical protein KCU93_g12, partial [Aureobasidium melanogenum]